MEYSKFLNPEVTAIPPSGIRKFFDIANTMEGVISLGVGEPDFVTPWKIRKAGITSLENGRTRYTANRGLADLRREITVYLKRKYRLSYDGDSEVLVTIGGSEAIDAVIRSLVCPGEEVLIPQPSYVCYEPMTRLAGGVPVIIETKAENEFKLTPEELLSAITDKTKLLILPYPCNPTVNVKVAHRRLSLGQRSRLIKHHGIAFAKFFQGFRAAEEDSHSRASPDTDGNGGGGCEPQRAGTGNDQHGNCGAECGFHVSRVKEYPQNKRNG